MKAKHTTHTAKSRTDRGADYNAFGRDPDGRLAYLAAWFWGPDYAPDYTVQQFVGLLEPPRYGPPAPYQIASLPPGWKPTPSPYAIRYGAPPASDPDFDLRPPRRFNRRRLDALRHIERFTKPGKLSVPTNVFQSHGMQIVSKRRRRMIAEEAEAGYETDIVDEEEEERKWRKHRDFPACH